MNVPLSPWTEQNRAVWRRIEAHAFEDPGVPLDFARRLQRAMGWPAATALAAIEEYRRFCFLATLGPVVTPSEEVDEVWHLHLTYTRDYWDQWCGEALGRRLHHDPTMGGAVEQGRFRRQYAETLALYETWFGPPDPRFWPGLGQRFRPKPRYRLVDGDSAFVLPRPWRLGEGSALRRAGTLAVSFILAFVLALAAPAVLHSLAAVPR